MVIAVQVHSPVKPRNLDRLQRRTYRRHTKFRGRRHQSKAGISRTSTQCGNALDGWASLCAPLPHWLLLLPCFILPPRVYTHADAFDILWEELQREQQITAFLAQHDPSSIVSNTNLPFFPTATAASEKGYVSDNLRILLNSIDSPRCFSSMTVLSSVIVDTGASVCIIPH
jgi:hypothetical protein